MTGGLQGKVRETECGRGPVGTGGNWLGDKGPVGARVKKSFNRIIHNPFPV